MATLPLVAFRFTSRVPPEDLIFAPAPISIELFACRVNTRAFASVWWISAPPSTEILLDACKVTLVLLSMATRFAAPMLWPPVSSAKAQIPSPSPPSAGTFPEYPLAAVIVMSVGSRSKVPYEPRGADVSTFPWNDSDCLPDTSTKPPFPLSAPPLAEICP